MLGILCFTDTCFVSHADRSTSINSLLTHTISFSQLNVDKDKEGEKGEQGEDISCGHRVYDQSGDLSYTSSSNLSRSLTSINTLSSVPHSRLLEDDGQLSLSSGHLEKTAESALSPDHSHGNHDGDNEGEMETAKGGYLGRFTNDRRGGLCMCVHKLFKAYYHVVIYRYTCICVDTVCLYVYNTACSSTDMRVLPYALQTAT